MVGDRKGEHLKPGFFKRFMKAEVRYFDTSEADAAWKWLQEGQESIKGPEPARQPAAIPDTYDVWHYAW